MLCSEAQAALRREAQSYLQAGTGSPEAASAGAAMCRERCIKSLPWSLRTAGFTITQTQALLATLPMDCPQGGTPHLGLLMNNHARQCPACFF